MARSRFSYAVCGLALDANRPIPALVPRESGSHAPSVRVTLGRDIEFPEIAIPDSVAPFGSSFIVNDSDVPLLRAWSHGSGAFIRLLNANGVDCLVDRSGRQIWMKWAAATVDPYAFLLEQVFSFVLRVRGFACLHASSAVINSQAVAMCGPSGVGKSILAASLAERGHHVLTDNVAAISRHGRRFVVHPGPCRLHARAAQPTAPAPLAAMWFLEPRPGQTAVRVDALRPSDAAMRLIGDTWARRLQDRTMRAQEIERVSQVVGTATARLLTFDPDRRWLQDACKAIEQLAFAAQPERRAS